LKNIENPDFDKMNKTNEVNNIIIKTTTTDLTNINKRTKQVENIQIPQKRKRISRPTQKFVFIGSDGKPITLQEIIMPSIGEQTSIENSTENSTENNNNKRKLEVLGVLVEELKEINEIEEKLLEKIDSRLKTLKEKY